MFTGYTDSGLVYTETVISTRQKGCTCLNRHVPMIFRPKNLNDVDYALGNSPQTHIQAMSKGRTRSKRSSISLKSMAIRSFLKNWKLVTPESLATVPELLLRELWTETQYSSRGNLHLWKCFAQSDIGDDEFNRYCNCDCSYPDLPLLIEATTSPTLAFLTNVTICNQTIQTSDTVCFTKMVNLQNFSVQMIYKAPIRIAVFNDAVMRSWATAAREHGAFSKLETIFLIGLNDVSHFSLSHLNSFPVLEVFCVQQCGNFHEQGAKVMTPGWHYEETKFEKFVRESPLRTGDMDKSESTLFEPDIFEHHNIIEFHTLAENYVHSRRRKQSNNRPLLNICFLPPHRRKAIRVDPANFTCYERDMDKPLRHFVEESSQARNQQGRVLKKRKTTTDKSNALRDFLDSM